MLRSCAPSFLQEYTSWASWSRCHSAFVTIVVFLPTLLPTAVEASQYWIQPHRVVYPVLLSHPSGIVFLSIPLSAREKHVFPSVLPLCIISISPLACLNAHYGVPAIPLHRPPITAGIHTEGRTKPQTIISRVFLLSLPVGRHVLGVPLSVSLFVSRDRRALARSACLGDPGRGFPFSVTFYF